MAPAAKRQAGKRQVRRSDPKNHEGFLRHARFRWLKVAVVLCLLAGFGYVFIDVRPRPTGNSAYGYALGTISALLILWLTLIGIRKRAITPGVWSLKAWTSAHVYLGLSLLVLATLHTGFSFGWNVHTLAYGLMVLVIVTGIYGVFAYATLPVKLSENRGETTQRQMLETIRTLDRQLNDAAQPLSRDAAAAVRKSIEKTVIAGGFWARLTGLRPGDAHAAAVSRLRALQRGGNAETARLEPVAALLARKSEMLSRLRRHIQIRTSLEVWLKIHVPATIALLAALTAHIVSVFFYW